ncbi:MAG: glycoside hydrolase family 3 C-terminal domain-containing protein [Dorea sp.]|nr:glycoside hydrolase family 3 C-terminal domain-containing protein [Dorea sp.]
MKKQKIYAAYTDAVTELELKNKEIAYQAALEGIVLLKNEQALPVKPGRIALFGAGVPMTVKGGTGSGEVNERHAVSILEGMEAAGYEIASKRWLEDYQKEYDQCYAAWKHGFKLGFDMINYMSSSFQLPAGRPVTEKDLEEARCNTAIYVAARQAGEGKDKKLEAGEFDLTSDEIESVKLLTKHYKKTILVINSGSYMNLAGLENEVDAVIFYCQQGMEGGRAFANLISGKVSPSGKLTDSWANSYQDVPCGDIFSYRNSDVRQQIYKEGIYVGYRYYDTYQVPVRYPFGFGLSYSKFSVQSEHVTLDGDTCTISVSVTNKGSFSGKEVVQLYASCPDGELKKEYQRLLAFQKTKQLDPGEKVSVAVTFTLSDLASYSEEAAAWMLEKGDYVLRIGTSSQDTDPVAIIQMPETTLVEKVRNICPVVDAFEEISPVVRKTQDDLSRCPVLIPDPDAVTCKAVTYEEQKAKWDKETRKILKRLTKKDMIDLVVGEGIIGMIDSSLNFAPGTVGRTTNKLVDKGLKNLNLADGPAGLRLLKESAINQKGKLRFIKGNYMLSAMNLLPEWLLKFLMAKEDSTKLYQYTTAFPVGTALAQTWNTDLCEEIGTAISQEMTQYGITYWLGPAMNIHRNPLCGRNFEYLSEDPVLTGKIAAALTRGAQSIPGNFATIKHFACNNAEEDRTHSNSVIHERALREIYLKGFEICVKEANPASVMTSYNLVNSVYTPNSYDLCTSLLRCEWGFDGLVMTDWFSTGSGQGTASAAIAAGNDLIMPGSSHDKKSIRKGLRTGEVSKKALLIAAGNIVDAIRKGTK